MLLNRKIWLNRSLIATTGAGLLVVGSLAGCSGGESGAGGEGGEAAQTQGSESGEAGQSGEAGEGGDFSGIVSKVLAGEGGEGGAGLTKGERTVSIAQLTDEQINQVVSGNTLRTEHHFAYHFDASGAGEGWEVQSGKSVPLPAAKWSVNGGKLCLTPAVSAVTGAGDCAEAYLILNKVALYGSDDKLVGKGSDLYAGKQLGETASR